MESTQCVGADCPGHVQENEERCPVCGLDNGPLNLRFRHDPDENATLANRYDGAWADCRARACDDVLQRLEAAVLASAAVVNETLDVVELLMTFDRQLYSNYVLQESAEQRRPAAPADDRRRRGVEATLFGKFGEQIRYAALSLDGFGLESYGPFSLKLKDTAIRHRASVLEDNSYFFVDKHHLHPGDPIPVGYRATWGDRHRLVVAKIGPRLSSRTSDGAFSQLVLHSTHKRTTDEFVEVHIYGGFNSQAVEEVAVRRGIRTLHRDTLDRIRDRVERAGAKWIEK